MSLPSANGESPELGAGSRDQVGTMLALAETAVCWLDGVMSRSLTRLELQLRVMRKSREPREWTVDDRLRALKAGDLGEPLRPNPHPF